MRDTSPPSARPAFGRRARRHGRVGASRRQRGQSLVEFALILPFFIAILGAVIAFGLALYMNMSVINAAREGARAGSMNSTVANMDAVVRARVNATGQQGGLTPANMVTTVLCVNGVGTTTASPCTWTLHTTTNTSGAQQGDSVRVQVSYTFTNPFPLSIRLGNTTVGLPATFTLGATVEMVLDAAQSG